MILGPEHVSEAGSRKLRGLGDVSSIHKGPPKILDKILLSPAPYLRCGAIIVKTDREVSEYQARRSLSACGSVAQ